MVGKVDLILNNNNNWLVVKGKFSSVVIWSEAILLNVALCSTNRISIYILLMNIRL